MPPALRGTTSKYFSRAKAGAGSDASPQRVPDYIVPNLHGAPSSEWLFLHPVLFCGINPGAESGARRHHYAHRSNHFYTCVHRSGLTTEQLTPALDYTFPWRDPYRLGLTNLAHRPTPKSEQLTMSELERGVPELIGKAVEHRPRIVCFVGKQIGQVWLSVLQKRGALDVQPPVRCILPKSVLGFWFEKPKKGYRGDTEFPPQDAGYGVLPACVVHDDGSLTLFFSTPSTSARVTHHQLPGKVRIMSHVVQLLEQFPKAESNGSEPSVRRPENGAQATADNAGPTRTVYIPVIDPSKAEVTA